MEKELDKDFHKVFFGQISEKDLEELHCTRLRLIIWVIQHLSLNNELKFTYEQIEEKTGISYQTVAKTMKALLDIGFLRRKGKILIANPKIIFRGSSKRREYVQRIFDGDTIPEKMKRLAQMKQQRATLDYEIHIIQQEIKHEEEAQKKLEKEKNKKKKASQKKAQQEPDTSSAVMEQEG